MTPFEWTISGFFVGLLVGRAWQYVRSPRDHAEALRALHGLMKISPQRALELLDGLLKTSVR